jgi:F-type H+-transporting ATPase subunit gamma
MATIRQVRSRIKVAKNIQQITKAMKMVAAARLKRAQDRVQAARPYARAMREMMTSLARAVGDSADLPQLEVRAPRNIGFLIVTSDRGLAGSYNSALLRRVVELLKGYDKERVRLYVAGRKGIAFLKRRGFNVVQEFAFANTGVTFGDARDITRIISDDFTNGQIDQLFMVYNSFLSAISQKPTDVQLLPIQTPDADDAAPGDEVEDYIFEPSADVLMRALLPRYLLFDTAAQPGATGWNYPRNLRDRGWRGGPQGLISIPNSEGRRQKAGGVRPRLLLSLFSLSCRETEPGCRTHFPLQRCRASATISSWWTDARMGTRTGRCWR